jgi:hypothetical protein
VSNGYCETIDPQSASITIPVEAAASRTDAKNA